MALEIWVNIGLKVMACCLTEPSHYLKPCWVFVDWSSVKSTDIHIRAISQEMPQPSITKIPWENYYISKNSFKFPRGQWVNMFKCEIPVAIFVIFLHSRHQTLVVKYAFPLSTPRVTGIIDWAYDHNPLLFLFFYNFYCLFQECSSSDGNCVWVTEDDCLQIQQRERKSVFIFEKFEGASFENITATNNRCCSWIEKKKKDSCKISRFLSSFRIFAIMIFHNFQSVFRIFYLKGKKHTVKPLI